MNTKTQTRIIMLLSTLFLGGCYLFVLEVGSDETVLYYMSVITLMSLLFALQFNKRLIGVNLLIFLLYSIYFYHGLFYKSTGGSGLVWWVYHLGLLCVHFLSLLVYLIVKIWKERRSVNL